MSIADKPLVNNFLNPSGHVVTFRRLPFTTFYCQDVTLPGVTLPVITAGNPFNKLPYSSTQIELGTFSMRFKVDENLKNYSEILNWIKGLGFPESFDQYIDNKTLNGREALRSDASLMVLTNSKNPNREITLVECVPLNLSPLQFTTTEDKEIDYVTATATFYVRDFTVAVINDCDPDG